MNPEIQAPLWLGLVVLAVIAASGVAAIVMSVRFLRGRVLAYEPRRPVPWIWADLVLIVLVHGILTEVVGVADVGLWGAAGRITSRPSRRCRRFAPTGGFTS